MIMGSYPVFVGSGCRTAPGWDGKYLIVRNCPSFAIVARRKNLYACITSGNSDQSITCLFLKKHRGKKMMCHHIHSRVCAVPHFRAAAHRLGSLGSSKRAHHGRLVQLQHPITVLQTADVRDQGATRHAGGCLRWGSRHVRKETQPGVRHRPVLQGRGVGHCWSTDLAVVSSWRS